MTAAARLVSAAVGLVCTVLLCVGFFVDRVQAIYSYLFAFVYVWTIVVGALFVLLIEHASGASWFVPIRRQCERVVAVLPFTILLLVPVLVFAKDAYPWVHWQSLPEVQREHVHQKLGWLNVPFFVVRSLAYVIVVAVFGEILRSLSLAQDRAAPEQAARSRSRMVRISVGGLVLLSFVLTFATWDWIMSLEPAWYSNLFGVYIFAGGTLAAFGFLGVLAIAGKRNGTLVQAVSGPHYHAIGRLQLTMVIFWAYIGWCHVFQQWIGNLPLELIWYAKRWYHGWQWEGLVLVLMHFLFPFLFLLPRALKKNPRTFLAISVWLTLVHAIDVHYLVLPALHPNRFELNWLDVVALFALSSLTFLFGSLRGRRHAAMPERDPLFGQGLAYESQP